ncbi:hypothetical protein OH77DRAFT_735803 [Trametes cingulata]|nr:hypothetical protein OH77DRAFT_735803 [Trametes cingulata]
MSSPFLELPVELKLIILQLCELEDMVALQEVCKEIRALTNALIEPIYKDELALSGMIDGPSRDAPVARRLQALRKYRVAWDSGNIPITPYEYRIDDTSEYLFCAGSHFALYMKKRGELRIYTPAAEYCGVRERKEVLKPLRDLNGSIEVIDYTQRLLVSARAGSDIRCRLLSLEDLSAHPEAAKSTLQDAAHCLPIIDIGRALKTQVLGELLACSTWDRYTSEVRIWNWKTGELLFTHAEKAKARWWLLSTSCLLWVGMHTDDVMPGILCFKLYDLGPKRGHTASNATPQPLCVLALPDLAENTDVVTYDAFARFPSPTPDQDAMFERDPTLTTFFLHMGLKNISTNGREGQSAEEHEERIPTPSPMG